MFLQTVVAALVAVALATPVKPIIDTSYAVVADVSGVVSSDSFSCFSDRYMSIVVVSAYDGTGNGKYDVNAGPNLYKASNVGLVTQVYMDPAPLSKTKNGTVQFEELFTGIQEAGITIRSIWFKVVDPTKWNQKCQSCNVAFIQQLMDAGKARHLPTGIFSSADDWKRITGDYKGIPNTNRVWYYKVNGKGSAGETSTTFGDFEPFGNWATPNMKQFGQQENVCNTILNRNVVGLGTDSIVFAPQGIENGKLIVG